MIAYCGINCDTCSIYAAANDPEKAEILARQWRDNGWGPALPEWFRCQGCNGPEDKLWSEDCSIRACGKARELDNCSLCQDFPCVKILAFEAEGGHHGQAVAVLRELARSRE